jgi:LytS/YehU family sensor histidine kinase
MVKISAKLENDGTDFFLRLSVFDTGAGKDAKDISRSNGIGLQNIKGRLKSYYGRKANLKLKTVDLQGTEATLEFPVKPTGAQASRLQPLRNQWKDVE